MTVSIMTDSPSLQTSVQLTWPPSGRVGIRDCSRPTAGCPPGAEAKRAPSLIYVNDPRTSYRFLVDTGCLYSLLPAQLSMPCDVTEELSALNGSKVNVYGHELLTVIA